MKRGMIMDKIFPELLEKENMCDYELYNANMKSAMSYSIIKILADSLKKHKYITKAKANYGG
jgi:hypothetical protein